MENISFFGNVPEMKGTHVEKHCETLINALQNLQKENETYGMELDSGVQVTYFESSKSYWLRALFSLKEEPNRTMTLFTLRVTNTAFPVTLDMNFIEEEDVNLGKVDCEEDEMDLEEMTFQCFTEEDLKEKVHYLSKLAFQKLMYNLKRDLEFR